ncbi:MAG: glycosyltransferase family 2 protein [Candidatus Marinimicrobia bacterium]|nr:glycosyltransferase family 2 protein [Candidatus Neomarinimicrobiota bacterium]
MSLISIVVPVYNEEESIVELSRQIRETIEPTDYEYEIIFIDDGSQDASYKIMQALSQDDPRIISIGFQRNNGKAAALNTGFQECNGDYVITMDGDLQDNPAEILDLIAVLDSGWDMVSGWKKVRHDPIGKRWPSKLYNFTVAKFSGIPIHDFNCGLKAYTRKVVKNIELYGDLHRYIPVLAKQKGFSCTEKVVQHRARKFGQSKYGFKRISGFFDLITVVFISKFIEKPLHLFGMVGMSSLMAGVLIDCYVLYLKFVLHASFQKHMALLLSGVLLIIVGIQFISLGLLGEMMTVSRKRPEPVIKDRTHAEN